MGVVTWYIFVIWFFGGFAISIGIGFGLYLLGFPIPLAAILGTLGLYVSWQSLNYARTLLIIEAKKTINEIIIINSLFVLSIVILYIAFFEFSGFSPNFITNYLFISTTIVFILFKTFMLRILRMPTNKF